MSVSVLKVPAYKILLEQLYNVHKCDNSKSTPYQKWDITLHPINNDKNTLNKHTLSVSNVWIQGYVTEILNDDSVLVNDETALALVNGISKIPKAKKSLQAGDYVMVIGYILAAGSKQCTLPVKHEDFAQNKICAKLKAIKVTDISKNTNCRTGDWWRYEVADAQSHILQTTDNS